MRSSSVLAEVVAAILRPRIRIRLVSSRICPEVMGEAREEGELEKGIFFIVCARSKVESTALSIHSVARF